MRQFTERYGVALGVLMALAAIVAFLPGNAQSNKVTTRGGNKDLAGGPQNSDPNNPDAGPGGGDPSATTPDGGPGATTLTGGTLPGGAPRGPGSGTTVPGSRPSGPTSDGVVIGSGPNCRADGRQIGVSYAMPPCRQWTGTDNGGATFRGVTKDKILVVRYIPQVDAATRQILVSADLSDTPAVVKRAHEALFRYGNLHYETYGREVVMLDFDASGPPTSDEASRADAIKISDEIKPFAVVEGEPAQGAPLALIKELARRNIACFCSVSAPSATYAALPPIVFSPLPTIDEYVNQAAEYTCKKLKDKPAAFAGAGVDKSKPRVFGLIYLAGQNGKIVPEQAQTGPIAEAAYAKCGIKFAKTIQYLYDPGRNQADVTNMMVQMKAANVTTIVPFWDPLYPILITQEATKQIYFPEWFMTGTGLSDTTSAGRLYDQTQWGHAFGISPLWVTWQTVAKSAGYREYHWARPGDAPGTEGVLINVYRARVAEVFISIQQAGPRLTNDTLTAGAFAYPKTGGGPARPLRFRNRAFPTDIKDFVEVFYDANAQGPDERGKQGPGMVTKTDGAKRYQAGQWSVGDPKAFQPGGLTVSDNPPGGGDSPTDSNPAAYPATKRCLSCV